MTNPQGCGVGRRDETVNKATVFGQTEHTIIRECRFEIMIEDKLLKSDVLNPLNPIIWWPGKQHVLTWSMWQFGQAK